MGANFGFSRCMGDGAWDTGNSEMCQAHKRKAAYGGSSAILGLLADRGEARVRERQREAEARAEFKRQLPKQHPQQCRLLVLRERRTTLVQQLSRVIFSTGSRVKIHKH